MPKLISILSKYNATFPRFGSAYLIIFMIFYSIKYATGQYFKSFSRYNSSIISEFLYVYFPL